MGHSLAFDVDFCGQYPNDRKDGWASIPYEWMLENSFTSITTDTSSPTTVSSSSGHFSIESTMDNCSNARRSSIWSEGATTPPVTPQRNVGWSGPAPHKITDRSFYFQGTTGDCVLEDDNIWLPDNAHLPLSFSSTTQGSTTHYQEEMMIGDEHILPLAPLVDDPALSRQIFSDPALVSPYQTSGSYRACWSTPAPTWVAPQTIAPKATFQALLSSSPLSKVHMSSPYRADMVEETNMLLLSSPPPLQSPYILPSQASPHNAHVLPSTKSRTRQPILSRRLCERSSRRQYNRKPLVPMTGRSRRSTNQVTCDSIIPQNTFPCTFPDCIDKSTGRQKRFKRQEHRKRHEVTVHNAEKEYVCWVPGCTTHGFNRTDNLKNHLRKTHGENNPGKRNRYVATLDVTSKFYDPSWQGELTDDGYPLVDGVTWHRCARPNCGKQYHLEERLRAHVLQQHGRKSSSSDISCTASSDGENDSNHSTLEDEVKTERYPED